MAAQDGITEYPVIETLKKYPHRFNFAQTVSLLEDYCASDESISVGMNGPCELESVLFRPYASLGFSSADVKKVDFLPAEKEGKKDKFRIGSGLNPD